MEDPRLNPRLMNELQAQSELYALNQTLESADTAHRIRPLDEHTPERPEPKQRPNFGVRTSQRIVTYPNGAVWIPNGRSDNPPPGLDPEKWAAMSRQARRAFASRVLNSGR